VETRTNGVVVEPGDADALAAALGRVLEDCRFAERLARERSSRPSTPLDARPLRGGAPPASRHRSPHPVIAAVSASAIRL
jgi:hypothetical protein